MRTISALLVVLLCLAVGLSAQQAPLRSTDSAGGANRIWTGDGTNIVPKTMPSCSNATTSKLLWDSTTNTPSCGTDQTGGGGSDPLDLTINGVREEFMNYITATGDIGTNGWGLSCTSGSVAGVASATPRFGIYRLTTGATSSNLCEIRLGYTSSTSTAFGTLSAYTFDSTFIFREPLGAETDVQVYVGWGVGTDVPTNGCYARYDTTLAPGDTTWKTVCSSNGTSNVFDTTIAPDSAWHKLRVRSTTAGTLLIQFDAGAEQSYTGTLPTNAQAAKFVVKTASAAAKTLEAEFFGWTVTGLSGR